MRRRNLWLCEVLLFLFMMFGCYLIKSGERREISPNSSIDKTSGSDVTKSENPHTIEKKEEKESWEEDSFMISRRPTRDKVKIYEISQEQIEYYKQQPAGTMIDMTGLNKEDVKVLFYEQEIDDTLKSRMEGKSYAKNATIPYEDLRYIRVLHVGFDGNTYIGELIMNKAVSEDILDIFWELYEKDYPIEKMRLIDDYDADDEKSMEDNNTSAFNFRFIAGTQKLSYHSRGLAIDINPLYNPYVREVEGEELISPSGCAAYARRDIENPYYIRKDDDIYNAFIKRGFTWGGEWINSKDYQHFQKSID